MADGFAAAASDWGQRVNKIRTSVERGRSETLKKAGMAGKTAHNAVIKRDSGGDMRLSGVGKRGARVGSRFDVRGDDVEFKATGPLHFVANPMSPHRIPRVRTRGRRRVVVIPGVGVRAYANHPGTKGKDTWNRGAKVARTKVSRELHDVHTNIVRKAFG